MRKRRRRSERYDTGKYTHKERRGKSDDKARDRARATIEFLIYF